MNEHMGCTSRSVKYSVVNTYVYFVNADCHVNASFKLLTAVWSDILPICEIYYMQNVNVICFLGM